MIAVLTYSTRTVYSCAHAQRTPEGAALPVPAAERGGAAAGATVGAPGSVWPPGGALPAGAGGCGLRCVRFVLRLEAAACCLRAARALCWERDPKPPRAWDTSVGIGFVSADFSKEL